MIVALDPSETRPSRKAAAVAPAVPQIPVPAVSAAETLAPPRRKGGRRALTFALGIAGVGALVAFGAGAMTVMGNLAAPQRPRILAASAQKAADWPALKDGLPVLVTGTATAPADARPAPQPVEAALPEAPPPVSQAARDALLLPSTASAAPVPLEAPPVRTVAAPPVGLPAIETVAPRGPGPDAPTMAPPAKAAATVPPRPIETVRARSAPAAFAALPPEPRAEVKAEVKSELKEEPKVAAQPAPPKVAAKPAEAVKPQPPRAMAKIEAKPDGKPESRAEPRPEAKATAQKAPAKPARVQSASAEPAPAAERDAGGETTEVFGIKVPSLAPAGRKIRESVEALGDAVKSLPDRF